MIRILDPRIRSEHIARYGEIETERYLSVIHNIPASPDDKLGENHHLLARSIWPEYANLKAHPWNRLRVSRAVHTALTELQGEFEQRFRFAALMMKGLTTDAQLEARRKGGTIGGKIGGKRTQELHPEIYREIGKKNVESGHLARLRTPEHQRAAGKIGGKIGGAKHVASGHISRLGKVQGPKSGKIAVESGQIFTLVNIGNCLRWNIRRGKPCFCGRHIGGGL